MSPYRFPAPAPRRSLRTEEDQPVERFDSNTQKKNNNTKTDARKNRPGDRSRRPAKDYPDKARRSAPRGEDLAKQESERDLPVASRTPPESGVRPDAPEPEAFLQPGLKPVTELLRQNPEKIDAVFLRKGRKGKDTDAIIDMCRRSGVRFSLVEERQLDRLWAGRHQGVIARLFATGFIDLADLFALAPDQPLPLILALDQVQDPGNAGALARTLYALGGAGILVPKHNGAYLGAAAARVAAGALDKLPVAKAANLAQALDLALDAGFVVYGAEAATPDGIAVATENVFSFTPRLPAVLVLGGEEGGLRPIVRKRCSGLISIPFAREFDSLNVAQAGAVIIGAFAATRDFSR